MLLYQLGSENNALFIVVYVCYLLLFMFAETCFLVIRFIM